MDLIPDPGATKLVCHNYRACAPEPGEMQLSSPHSLEASAAQQENPLQREAWALQLESWPCSLKLEKSPSSSEDPKQPKINI